MNSIEDIIAANTAALIANTQALNAVLAASGTTPAAAPAPAPTPAPTPAAPAPEPKKTKGKAKPEIAALPDPEPEPAAEDTPEPEESAPFATDDTMSRDEALQEISTTVKGWLQGLGSDLPKGMAAYTTLRAEWKIKAATELSEDQLGPFMAAVRKMMATPLV